MIIDADLAALEWRVGAQLSQDRTMIQEIVDGVDIHTANAIAIFGDPRFRQESKVVSFRSLYGGSAYAFFMDARMPKLPLERWEAISEAFYKKYAGLGKWQKANYQFVCKHGYYKTFTGRHYKFKPKRKNDGTLEYPWPSVCNFATQGTATGDVVPLVLVKLLPILKRISPEIKLINQVHDSIVLDCPDKYVEIVCQTCLEMFRAIPRLIKEHYDYDWIVKMDGECKFGYNWSDMQTYKEN